MINLSKEEFEKLPYFINIFTDTIRKGPNGLLYKRFRSTPSSLEIEFLCYLNSLSNIEGLLLPTDLLKDEGIYGLAMPEVKNAQNIDEFLTNPKVNIDIKDIIKKLHEYLTNIHNYLVLGDIRNTNILLTEEKPIFIDIEGSKKKDSPYDLNVFYYVKVDGRVMPLNALSDLFKTFISSLSLIYDISFEKYFVNKDMTILLDLLKKINADISLVYYLDYLINQAKEQQDYANFSLSELIDDITLPTENEKERLVRSLPRPAFKR